MLHPARPTTTAPAGPVDAGPADAALATATEERLVARYATDPAQVEAVRGAVADAWGRLSGARIRAFLPILVERSVRLRLADTA